MFTHQVDAINELKLAPDSRRLLGADLLKSFAIFAVVFIHGSSVIPYVRANYIDIVSQFIRFCVPIFILIWAFFTEKSISKSSDKISYLKSRFMKLLMPFFFWSTIYFLIIVDFNTLKPIKFFTMHWFGRGWSGQYYFIILFQLIPLFIIIRTFTLRYMRNSLTVILLSTLFYLIIAYSPLFTVSLIDKIGDELFVYWIPYVILGVFYAHYGIPRNLALPVPIGLLLLLLISIEFYFFKPLSKPYLTPTVFACSIMFFNSIMSSRVSLLKENQLATKTIGILATNTLGIFCLNPLVIIVVSPFTNSLGITLSYWGCALITPILSTSLIIAICLGLIYFLKYIKLGILVAN